MTRQGFRNQINKILREKTAGYHTDQFWTPINEAFQALRNIGIEVTITNTWYDQDERWNPIRKTWQIEIPFGDKKPLHGVIIAAGAGTIAEPLATYDVVAYVS